MTKRKITSILSLLLAVLVIILKESKLNNQPSTPTQDTEFDAQQTTQSTETVKITREGPYKVVKVVDGDTLDIDINNKTTKIRIIGLNTPETVDPRKKVECFGKEASLQAKTLLNNHHIFIESDSSQQNADKYGRLLRYVFLEDGTNYSEWMIKNGYGYEYTYDNPYRYMEIFKKAQHLAETSKAGLWADNICK